MSFKFVFLFLGFWNVAINEAGPQTPDMSPHYKYLNQDLVSEVTLSTPLYTTYTDIFSIGDLVKKFYPTCVLDRASFQPYRKLILVKSQACEEQRRRSFISLEDFMANHMRDDGIEEAYVLRKGENGGMAVEHVALPDRYGDYVIRELHDIFRSGVKVSGWYLLECIKWKSQEIDIEVQKLFDLIK